MDTSELSSYIPHVMRSHIAPPNRYLLRRYACVSSVRRDSECTKAIHHQTGGLWLLLGKKPYIRADRRHCAVATQTAVHCRTNTHARESLTLSIRIHTATDRATWHSDSGAQRAQYIHSELTQAQLAQIEAHAAASREKGHELDNTHVT